MAVIVAISGSQTGVCFPLRGERTVLGRHPNCQIVLDDTSISRHHAQVLESHGHYYLEDLRSRNGTRLNGKMIRRRMELTEGDEVAVCDFTFTFHQQPPVALEKEKLRPNEQATRVVARFNETLSNDDATQQGIFADVAKTVGKMPALPPKSSIIKVMDAGPKSAVQIDIRPEAKLKALLEFSMALGRLLKVDEVLAAALKSLFSVFPQAESGFVLLRDVATQKLQLRCTRVRSEEGQSSDDLPISMTIVRQALQIQKAILSENVLGDQRFDSSESLAALGIQSVLCVPLMNAEGQPMGVIQLSSISLQHPFTGDDLDLLLAISTQAVLALENAELHEAAIHQRDLERELEFATQVQLGFLPHERPAVPGYEFADYYEAAHRVGGDYFDYIPLPNGQIAIAVGDVAGKGIPAALLMARLYAAARYHLLSAPSLGEALGNLNREVTSCGLGFRFITLTIAVLDPVTNSVRLVNAGHLPPILRRADGSAEVLGTEQSGMPLGIAKPGTVYAEVTFPLDPDVALVFYTDGVTEAMNTSKEMFGRKRLLETICSAPKAVHSLVSTVIGQVEVFYESLAQRDDLCVVAVHRLGEDSHAS